MNQIVEVSEDGILSLPSELLGKAKPHTRYAVKLQGKAVILTPIDEKQPLWATGTPEERVEALKRWVESHETPARISDEALRRENLYD